MSKVYIVTEEFLQEAYKAACAEWKQKIETEFPEACLGEFKPNRWYKRKDNLQLVFIEKITDNEIKGYGFDTTEFSESFGECEWNISREWCHFKRDKKEYEKLFMEATKEEVEKGIKEEALRRYGKNWEKIKVEPLKEKCPSNNTGVYNTRFFFECNELWNKNGLLFKDGKWAKVIEDKCSEKEELLQQLQQLREKIEKLC